MIRQMLRLLSEKDKRPAGKRWLEHAAPQKPTAWSRRELLFMPRHNPDADRRWAVLIDADRCTDCMACIRICHTQALERRVEKRSVEYRLKASQCDGCSDCPTVCAEHALRLEESSRVTEMVVARLPIEPCRVCGESQAGLVLGRCAICRQRARGLAVSGDRLR